MATTSAERQRAYRARQSCAGENGERRLQTWVSTAAALALGRLARHAGMTRPTFLEKLVLDADQVITRAMSDETFDKYLALPRNKR
ncbi:MAG: hypothetical protein V5B40_12395 [Candidatus Accumulibacter meliphilus]|jgi:hypothetical protein|uniref:hypothetical protein n=1 Tax=Candidatus Accumulibacter meliphilus TaxID=2211374 RepID=UPI002FC32219